jgi:hypothetical protein
MISRFRLEPDLFALMPLEFLSQVDFRFLGLVRQLSRRKELEMTSVAHRHRWRLAAAL